MFNFVNDIKYSLSFIIYRTTMNTNKLAIVVIVFLATLFTVKAKAQTNAQVLYDFGSDRKFVTLTLEMFKQDKWGSTYFFVDHDFNYDKVTDSKHNVYPSSG